MKPDIDVGTLNAINKAMHKHGFAEYRAYFRWGNTPAFRNEERSQYYFVDRHVVDDQIVYMVVTPQGLLKHLTDTWRPVRREDEDYFTLQMTSDLMELPRTPEWPHGEILPPHAAVAKPKPQFTAEEIRDGMTGICFECHEEQHGCEPDMRNGTCESCGKKRVFGLEEALFMGEIELDMEGDE